MTNFNWYVVYTKPRYELKVANLLARKNIKNYCPLHGADNEIGDPKKAILEPLFKSFVFVYIDTAQIKFLLKIPGVLNFLYWRDKPVTVTEEEIEALVNLSKEYTNLKLEKYLINPGQRKEAEEMAMTNSDITADPEDNSENIKVVLPSLGYFVIAERIFE